MTTFKMINQDFVKLDRLMFLLTALKIAYVLDPSYQNFLNQLIEILIKLRQNAINMKKMKWYARDIF
jgi:hypothetical protein